MKAYLYDFEVSDESVLNSNHTNMKNNTDENISVSIRSYPRIDFFIWRTVYFDIGNTTPDIKLRTSYNGTYLTQPKNLTKKRFREVTVSPFSEYVLTEYNIGQIHSLMFEEDYINQDTTKEIPWYKIKDNQIYFENVMDTNKRTNYVIDYTTRDQVLHEPSNYLIFEIELKPGDYINDFMVTWDSMYYVNDNQRMYSFLRGV